VAGQITYFAYDMGLPSYPNVATPVLLAELPLTGVSWSSSLNTPGSFSGTLNLNDPRIEYLATISTQPGRTYLIVDLDGTIVWGGIIWTRTYDNQDNLLNITGSEAWSYFQYRVQAQDYNLAPTSDYNYSGGPTFWSSDPAYTYAIAAQIISDATASFGSIFVNWRRNATSSFYSGGINQWVDQYVEVSDAQQITPSFPITQYQTVDSIITSLCQSGYAVGFDWAVDWSWSDGTGSIPIPTCNIHFPVRGRPVSVTGFAIDTELAAPYSFPEDATQMADLVWGIASGSGGFASSATMFASMSAGYPLLETVNTYSNINDQESLIGSVQDDLFLSQLPVITPTFTVPLYGEETIDIRDVQMGDNVTCFITADARFPYTGGAVYNLRITGTDVTVADEGVSTVMYTCTNPPGQVGIDGGPVGSVYIPPYSGGGSVTPPVPPAPPSPSGPRYLSSLPAHSLTLVRWAILMPDDMDLSSDEVAPNLSLQMYPYIETQTAGLYMSDWSMISTQLNLAGEVLLDSDNLTHALPYLWVGSSNLPAHVAGTLTFLSWGKTDDTLAAWGVYVTDNAGADPVIWTASSSYPSSGFGFIS
jgi:hypothetical protein